MTGTLFLVATPIGNLEDITLRALRVLREADGVLAEDTRRTHILLKHHGVATPLASLHAHTSESRIGTLADAQAWAAEIAGFAPLALQHAKRVLNDDGAYDDPRPEHQEMFDRAWGSQDVIEAQVARIEKRPPNFTGA